MKKLKFIAGAAALVSVGTLAGTLMPAASQTAQSFRACEYNKGGYELDVDADDSGDFSAGDHSYFHDPIYGPGSKKRIGTDAGTLSFIRTHGERDALFAVAVTWKFPKGQISAQGFSRFSKLADRGADFPITGGTGAYRNATGQVTVDTGRCNGQGATKFHFQLG